MECIACGEWLNALFILYEGRGNGKEPQDEKVNLDLVGKLVLRAGRKSGRGGPQLALNREAKQIISTLWNMRVEDWGRWEKTWFQKVLGESPVKNTRKRIRNRTRGLGRKGKPEKHELVKVWLEAVALIFHPWEPVNQLNSTPVWMTMLFKSKAYIWSYNIWWNQIPHFKETKNIKRK